MRKQLMKAITLAFVGLVAFPALSLAQDFKNVTGEADVTGYVGSGQNESAKFDEYTDRSNGATGDLKLNYDDKSKDEYLHFNATDVTRDDQSYGLTGGHYGEYKFDASYTELPHNLYRGAKTLYDGVGSDTLTLPDSFQQSIQTAGSDLVNRLNEAFANADEVDLSIHRRTGKGSVTYQGFDPFTLKVEASHEQRSGKRPLMGTFGFDSATELVEPVEYQTTNARMTLEYASAPFLANFNYYLSVFQNDKSSLTFDNVFSAVDGAVPSKGRIDLAPNNVYHGPSLLLSYNELPWKGRMTFNGSWGFLSQNDDLLPYTTNTTILGDMNGREFAAADPENLPASSPDLAVTTQLYNLNYTAAPVDWIDMRARYRYYNYDNNSDAIEFPGYVRTDSSWQEGPVDATHSSYDKQTAGADVGFKVEKDTRLGLDYNWIGTHRDHREVKTQGDNILGASVNHNVNDWVTTRTSYEKSFRNIGDYDFSEPFGDEEQPPQNPWLRKYDEADRQTDKVNFLATLTPMDALAFSGNFQYGQSDYTESLFGLQADRFYNISTDVDWKATDWVSCNAFYSYEQHNARQSDRQWNPAGLGDPYVTDTTPQSLSNWSANAEDKIHTVGGGVSFTIMPKVLFFDVDYTYTDAHGTMDFASPLGTAADDLNAYVPQPYDSVDRTILQRVNPKVRYKIDKSWDLTVGYLWERYDFNDFAGDNFVNVPVTATGAFNGAVLGGSYPYEDYTVNLGYGTLRYKF